MRNSFVRRRCRMRVLMISDVYFPRVNGVSTSIQTFRRDLAALGCETWLVAPPTRKRGTTTSASLRQPSRYLAFDPEDRMMKRRATLAAVTRARGQRRVVHVQTPFVAHRFGLKVARELGSRRRDVPHVLRGISAPLPAAAAAARMARAFARQVSRRQCNAVDAVVAPSQQLADVLAATASRASIHTIPTGLESRRVRRRRRRRFRAEHGIAPDRPVMLLVGRVAHEKNIGFLFDVLAEVRRRVPNVLFVIAGEGPCACLRCAARPRRRARRATSVRRLSRPARRAARLLSRRGRVRVRVAHRDAGPRAARESRARRARRLDGRPRHEGGAARRGRRARRRRGRRGIRRRSREACYAPGLRARARERRPRIRRAPLVEPEMARRLLGLYERGRRDEVRGLDDGAIGRRGVAPLERALKRAATPTGR